MSARILLLEDEILLAMDLADQLQDAGFEVVGPVTTTARALQLIEGTGCDAAVLDVNLGTETSEAVAVALRARQTPFIVLSGNNREHQPDVFRTAPHVAKPFRPNELMAALRGCLP